MHRRFAGLYLTLVFLSLGGCATESVPVVLKFRTENSFLFTNSGRVLAYAPGEIDCLDTTQVPEATPVLDTGIQDLCAFYRQEVLLEDLPEGELEFLFIGYDENDTGILLHGCSTGQREQEQIELRFSVTDLYEQLTDETTRPPCPSVEARCSGSCGS